MQIFFVLVTFMLVGAGCVTLGGKSQTQSGASGMFVSVNKGETWQSISAMPTATGVKNISDRSVYKLFTDPQDTSALYWATPRNGFVFSYDEGRTWQQPAGDLQNGPIYSIAVHPNEKCTIFVTNGDKVFRTEDCNRSWEEMYRESRPNVRVASIVINPLSPYQIFMVESNGDLLESVDSGKSWSTIKRFEIELADIYADPLQKEVFYIASKKDGLFRSLNTGATWESLGETMNDYAKSNEYRRFLAHPEISGRLYWISTYGILFSTDSGSTWNPISLITPPGSAQIYGFYVSPENDDEIYYTATIKDKTNSLERSTFYKSEDGGVRWITKRLPSGQLPTVLYVHPTKTDILYLGFTIPPKR